MLALLQSVLIILASFQSIPNPPPNLEKQIVTLAEQVIFTVSNEITQNTSTETVVHNTLSTRGLQNQRVAPRPLTKTEKEEEAANNGPFEVVWIEPHNLNQNVTPRTGAVTTSDVRQVVQFYKQKGIHTIVVAYAEYLDCFLYTPQKDFSFYSYNTGKTINSKDKNHFCKLVSDGDFFTVLLDEASKQNMKVIIGLSRGGDLALLEDIDAKIRTNSTLHIPETSGKTINDRISQTYNVSIAVAEDLYAQYGSYPAFYGWYIAHETDCLDIGNNIYIPIADSLKEITPQKKVMISPTADAKICYNNQSYEQAINLSEVDIYAYQDTIGSGYRRIDNIGDNFYTEASRNIRIRELEDLFKKLKSAHDNTNTDYWINVEAWRMDGTCPVNNGYGCNFPGDWTSVVKQITAWEKSSVRPDALMLNEGLTQFDFGIKNMTVMDAANRVRAEVFTRNYLEYIKNL